MVHSDRMAQNIALSVRTDFQSCFIPTTCIGFVEYDPRGVLNRSVGDRTDVMTLPSLFSPLENRCKRMNCNGFAVVALAYY